MPTNVASPSPTVAPRVGLSFSATQLTFGASVNSQTFEIINTGNMGTTWTLVPGDSASLLNFSATTGFLAAGAKATITINTAVTNQGSRNLTTSFQVSASGQTPQLIAVTIQPKPLPTALINTGGVTGSLPLTVTVGLTVTTSALTQVADHAVITANYKTCDTCASADVVIGRLSATNTASLVWDTRLVIPQDGIKLAGKICSSSDESNCGDIPALTGLSIAMSATFTSPSNSSQLITTTKIVLAPSGRANRVVLAYSSTQNVNPLPLQDAKPALFLSKIGQWTGIPPRSCPTCNRSVRLMW